MTALTKSAADPTLRPMREADAAAVLRIYREGIDTGQATFQPVAPAWADWDRTHRADCRLVAEIDGAPVGWAALAPTSARPIYRGVAEVSLYVAAAARGFGLGRCLLERLVAVSEGAGIWSLQAGIFPENRASLAVHAACGFRHLGTRERIGRMGHGPFAGCWRDVCLLERRSAAVGLD